MDEDLDNVQKTGFRPLTQIQKGAREQCDPRSLTNLKVLTPKTSGGPYIVAQAMFNGRRVGFDSDRSVPVVSQHNSAPRGWMATKRGKSENHG
ncbi:hypothetical protein N7468_001171 [Penicillium chermesinum]|uniref:Uncharacterized protein n=1 Tax=Penicillium chermesinum TaxID=63820 RepID=A0A9W9TX30_9EURO|nr:uncharacterized protein N7468_001171 [Penicillium chermesinum]KAJ5246188.1 hypothetical protein N7468_001171 [Penicillium chermesinum]